jgi:hypothetical protein
VSNCRKVVKLLAIDAGLTTDAPEALAVAVGIELVAAAKRGLTMVFL